MSQKAKIIPIRPGLNPFQGKTAVSVPDIQPPRRVGKHGATMVLTSDECWIISMVRYVLSKDVGRFGRIMGCVSDEVYLLDKAEAPRSKRP